MSNMEFPGTGAGVGPCRRAGAGDAGKHRVVAESRAPGVPAARRRIVASLLLGLFLVSGFSAGARADANDQVQMTDVKKEVAEFGNYEKNGGIRVKVKIGDGLSPKGIDRFINYKVGGTASRGDGKDYTIKDCTSSTCSVKLPANAHSAPSAVITIYVNDDGLDENDETIVLTLQNGDDYTVNNEKKTTTVTIRDDDTRGLTFHRRWADVEEGSEVTHTLRLSSQPTAAVTVEIVSNNPDVTVSPTSLTFNPSGNNLWSRTQTVTVSAAQDDDAVDDTAILTYTTSGGDYGGANALSIRRPVSVDDDDPSGTRLGPQLPRITLTGGAAVTEGSPAIFTVNADPAPTVRLTVNVEVIEPPGQDFVAASQEGVRTVTLNAGATSTTFTVPTVNDNTDEDDGAVQVWVNDGTGYRADGGAAVTVRDNDNPIPAAFFVSGSSSAAEDAGTQNVTVNLSLAAPSGGLTLGYSVGGTATAGSGNDFTIQNSGTVSIAVGASTATIPVAINDDSSAESAETVILTLTGGTGYTLGSPTTHALTITDNDGGPAQPAVSFAAGSSSAAESAGTHNVRVNLAPAAPSGGLTLGYSVGGTATAGSGNDFTIQNSGTLSLAAGATTATIPVVINDDGTNENAETVILTLTDGTGYTLGSPSVHTLTITDNDSPTQPAASFAAGSSSAAEDAGTHDVTVNLSSAAPSGGLTLSYDVTGSATAGDFTIQNSGTLSLAAGATTATIPVVINDDGTNENAETVILTLSSGTGYTVGSPSVHTLTITDNDSSGQPAASFAAGSSSAAEDAGTHDVTVNLSSAAPSGGLTLSYDVTGSATAGGGNDFTIQNSGSLSLAAGATTATIPVVINDDGTNENAETIILTLTDGTGYTLGNTPVHALIIHDNDDEQTTVRRDEPPTVPDETAPAPTTTSPDKTTTTTTIDRDETTTATTIPVVSIAGGDAITEGGTARFTLTASPVPTGRIMVRAQIEGSNSRMSGSQDGMRLVTIGTTGTTTLTVITTDDDTVEADGSITVTVRPGTGYTVAVAPDDAASIGVADNDVTPVAQANSMPTAWLARFGRMVAGQALDGLAGRMAASRSAGLAGNIGGRAFGFGSQARPGLDPGAGAGGTGTAPGSAGLGGGSDIDRSFGPERATGASGTLAGRDLLLGSRFTLTGKRDATGGSLAFWGQAAQSGFDGREGMISLDGEATSAMLGADYARDRWLAGMALMQSGGEGDYRVTDAGTASRTCPAGGDPCGEVESTLTVAIPYASLQASERLKLWGALGYGIGEVTLKPARGSGSGSGGALTSDLSWTMAAAGLRSEVIPPPEDGSGPALALVSDTLWARTGSDKTHELAGSDSDVMRLRLGLEGSWMMAMQDGGRMTPKLEAGLRRDDGDAETGFGVELGGGFVWIEPRRGLSLDLSGRTLVTHGADELEDRGFAASLVFDPYPSTKRHLSLTLGQEIGGASSGGLDMLFETDPLSERAGSKSDTRWTAEAAWGFPAFGSSLTGSPHVRLGIATRARDYTLGWRLSPETGALDFGFGVAATRHENEGVAPWHGIGVELNTRW